MAKFVGENGLMHYTDKIESISNGEIDQLFVK